MTFTKPQSAVYGQTLVAVDGSYDDVNRLTSELAETDEFEDTAFVNQNVRPYYAEGSKTMGYEIAEQLGWRIPAQVVIPMASRTSSSVMSSTAPPVSRQMSST